MKNIVLFMMTALLGACSFLSDDGPVYVEPDYNGIARHVKVIHQSPKYVIYEYSDIRVDEIAPVAAIYCNNRGGRQAALYDISLRPDHRRRATFVCE